MFESRTVQTARGFIHVRLGGTGPALLLLHGFPETSLMWRDVAPLLATDFTVICADLPGQGESGPFAGQDAYSKRSMGDGLVEAMDRLGHPRFAVAGHDRGGRVAYRMALDHPDPVRALAVLDIVPIADALDRADDRMLLSFWPWSLMSQPAPLPERLVSAAPDAVIEDSASQWGTDAGAFPDDVKQAYASALRDPARVHQVCEEFRAAATVDREHDKADRAQAKQIGQPTLVLWDRTGALSKWYEREGGPLGLWRKWAPAAQGEAVDGGHFFAEAEPAATADRLRSFFHAC